MILNFKQNKKWYILLFTYDNVRSIKRETNLLRMPPYNILQHCAEELIVPHAKDQVSYWYIKRLNMYILYSIKSAGFSVNCQYLSRTKKVDLTTIKNTYNPSSKGLKDRWHSEKKYWTTSWIVCMIKFLYSFLHFSHLFHSCCCIIELKKCITLLYIWSLWDRKPPVRRQSRLTLYTFAVSFNNRDF